MAYNITKLYKYEWEALSRLTGLLKLDDDFDIAETAPDSDDCFIKYDEEYDEYDFIPLSQGLQWIYDSIAYTGKHDGLTEPECKAIAELMVEFNIADDKWANWYTSKEE